MLISFPGLDRITGKARPDAQWAAPLHQIRAYWDALRDGPLPPFRSQIDPRGIEGALGGAFILERVAPGVARFRIAGNSLADLAGCDPRGMPFSVLFEPAARRAIADTLNQVFDGPAVIDLRLDAERNIARPNLTARMMLLPLRNDAGVIDLAVGCLALSADPGRRSRRFHIASTHTTPLVDAAPRLVAKHAAFTAIRPAPAGAFAESSPAFVPATSGPARPYLRLVRPAG